MISGTRRKLKVVADTNILISGVHFGGNAEIFLGMAASRLFHLVISKYILWEFRIVLKKKLGWSLKETQEACETIVAIAEVVNPKRSISAVKNDEADNRILECAVAACADVLVTNDKRHLLPLRSFQGVQIINLHDFLAHFRP